MYYQPRIIDKGGRLKAAVAAIEAATGLKKSIIVAQLLREGVKKAARANQQVKTIMDSVKED